MFVLHVDIKVKPGLEPSLEKTYTENFRPAISAQPGFGGVQLLRSRDAGGAYRLTIAFDRQASQQTWIATDLHQQVWPQMEDRFAECSIQYYDTVERGGVS